MDMASTLPLSSRLPVENLSASFNNVTNSYKFYWLLALLEHIQETRTQTVPIEQLLARMVASVWYPANYFQLSFGKQDRLNHIALSIQRETGLSADAGKQEVYAAVLAYITSSSPLAQEISSLGAYVPFRFLRPFFSVQLRGEVDWKVNGLIQQLADQTFTHPHKPCLYRFSSNLNSIEIHPLWFEYLHTHLAIVTGFCLWQLLNYLQKNNPNVPNIAAKLFEPGRRILNESRRFWRLAFDQLGVIFCIYSGKPMQKAAFSLDHFLPWRFVAHDLLWNIIPTPRYVNSAKSDALPNFGLYFEPFARLQHDAFQIVAALQKERMLEDYAVLFKKQSISQVQALPYNAFKAVLHDTIAPQIQIAKNMGFAADWSYTAT